jgi:hypothetical protein
MQPICNAVHISPIKSLLSGVKTVQSDGELIFSIFILIDTAEHKKIIFSYFDEKSNNIIIDYLIINLKLLLIYPRLDFLRNIKKG